MGVAAAPDGRMLNYLGILESLHVNSIVPFIVSSHVRSIGMLLPGGIRLTADT